MTKIKYFKIPFWKVHSLKTSLTNQGCKTFSKDGKKKYFQFDDMIVCLERNIATVVYNATLSDDVINQFFLSGV